jgi:hypothetical protein
MKKNAERLSQFSVTVKEKRRKKMGNKNSGRRVKPLKGKPKPERVPLSDGRVMFVGISAAARWLKCSPSALSAVCRGIPGRGERLKRRAKKAFPQLFTEQNK